MINNLSIIAVILILIGGINWGLIGAFKFNLVEYLSQKIIQTDKYNKYVYLLVGLSVAYIIFASIYFKVPQCKISLQAEILELKVIRGGNDFHVQAKIAVENGDAVVYWTDDDFLQDHNDPHGHLDKITHINSGKVPVENGIATINLHYGELLDNREQRILYRVIGMNGILSEIKEMIVTY